MVSITYLAFFSLSSIFLLLVAVFYQNSSRFSSLFNLLCKLAIMICTLSLALLLFNYKVVMEPGVTVFMFGGLAKFTRSVFFISAVILILGSALSFFFLLYFEANSAPPAEFIFLLFSVILGALVFVLSNDLILVYLGLEMQTMPLYVLLGLSKDNKKNIEASLRYFVFSLVVSGSLLVGFSLIYFTSGLTNLSELMVFSTLANLPGVLPFGSKMGLYNILNCFGIFLILICFLFKLSAAPLYYWAPDVYDGAQLPVIFIFSTIPKTSSIFVFFGLFTEVFGPFSWLWLDLILLSGFLSIIIGTFGAFRATKVARFLAFSGTAHIGFMLLCVAAYVFSVAETYLLFYLISYLIATTVFFFVWGAFHVNQKPLIFVHEFSGLVLVDRFLATVLAITLFSFAGIPPLVGFAAKFLILKLLVIVNLKASALFVFTFSAATAVYYLRFVRFTFFNPLSTQIITVKRNFKCSYLYKCALLFLTSASILLPILLRFF